jgi:hypothetical protein
MIASSRKSTFTPTISRQFEFSRLQDHTISYAYEALIPAVPGQLERNQPRRSNTGIDRTGARSLRPFAEGA